MSFTGLAEGQLGPEPRRPFFDGLTFHRVVPDFVVQGGDPQGDGEGGPGYEFPDELVPGLRHDQVGILSMANAGPDTNGSQFFFTLRPVNRLNYLHSVFGQVVSGLAVLTTLQPSDPITSVRILRVGEAAQAFQNNQAAFDQQLAVTPRYQGESEPGPAAHFDDPHQRLPIEPARAAHFNFKLANFERSTGIRVAARVYPTFTPATPDQSVSSFARALAGQLGIVENGALALYFADPDAWYLWLGDLPSDHFAAPGQRLHEAKAQFYDAVKAQAAAFTRAAEAKATAERPLTEADRIKYSVDALLDILLVRMEPGATH